MPKVSVIIPTYNGSDVIKDTIDSVLLQTESDLEVIVVDDGSTDDTSKVVKSFKDVRIKYFYKDNRGFSSACNYGLSKAKGQYVAFLDHDDLWPVNYLAITLIGLEKHPEFGLAYSPITVRYSDGTEVKSYKSPPGKSGWLTMELFKTGFIWNSAVVVRRSVLEGFYWDESLTSYEDGDYFLRLSVRTPFLFVPDVEAIRREHGQNFSKKVGVLPTRILVLERFYCRLGGEKIVNARIANRKISHSCRKVAKAYCSEGKRAAAILLYKHAIRYYPVDLRLYFGLSRALLLSKRNDKMPAWRMPEPLTDVVC